MSCAGIRSPDQEHGPSRFVVYIARADPHQLIGVSIQLHPTVLSLSNTKQYLETLRTERGRAAVHSRVQKAVLQLAVDSTPNHVAPTETVIQVDDQ